MARPSNAERFKKIVDEAAAAPDDKTRQAVISRAAKRKFVAPKVKRATGKPSAYTERLGIEICERLAQGEVLPEIVKDLRISINTVYHWIEIDANGFRERYRTARLKMAETLVDNLLMETRHIEKDQALAIKVRASIIQWYSGKVNPVQFGDNRRIELQGQITHTHAHQLEDHQKRKIAEAWLMSKQLDDSPGIVSTTTGPDLEGVSVIDEPARELPKRKKPALPAKMKASPGHDDSSNTRWRGKNDEDAD